MHTKNWLDQLKIGDLVSIAHGIDKIDVGVVEAIEERRIMVGWAEEDFSLFFDKQGSEIENEQEGGFYTGAISKIVPFRMEDYARQEYFLMQSLADFIEREVRHKYDSYKVVTDILGDTIKKLLTHEESVT